MKPLVFSHLLHNKFKLHLNFKSQRLISLMSKCQDKACSSKNDKTGTGKKLFHPIAPRVISSSNKVTVVGVGAVGMACAATLLSQKITTQLAFVDLDKNKLTGEKLDFLHGSQLLGSAKIIGSTDYKISAGSRICIITAGVRQKKGETRLDLVQRNADVLKNIIPELVTHSPDTILLITTNPCDVLTYVAWKLSGFPKHKVIGTGTTVDSSRFGFLISQKLKTFPANCRGYIIGEHGDSSVAVWSSVTVGGVRLLDINPKAGTCDDPERWIDIHEQVRRSGYRVRELKGYTSWAIAFSVAKICDNILKNSNEILPVTVPVKGLHGIDEEIFISLPAVLGENGISEIVVQQLNKDELCGFQNSAAIVYKVQESIKC